MEQEYFDFIFIHFKLGEVSYYKNVYHMCKVHTVLLLETLTSQTHKQKTKNKYALLPIYIHFFILL